ncbi:MAG: general secretion pathway protein GspF [Gammaproteobacteria bacterium]|nr:general secretion pathway protein GspF [Gammaproteobacteria bacterium]
MVIKIKRKAHKIDEPLLHACHKRPVTRREFLGAGLISGGAFVMGDSLLMSLLSRPAFAATLESCGTGLTAGQKIPFIAFDLGGGANMAGSSVLIGGPGGQMNFLGTAAYNKMGLPGDMVPGLAETTPTATSNGDHTDTSFGLAQHSDSAFLRGMLAVTTPATRANTNGFVIPARSDNDTGNNPHNPMYGIYKCGARGQLLDLIGSRASVSGGNSEAPASMIDLQAQPTKIDRASDVLGLIDTGGLAEDLFGGNTVAAARVMEAVEHISAAKLGLGGSGNVNVPLTVKDFAHCAYLKTSYNVEHFGSPELLDPRTAATQLLTGVSFPDVQNFTVDPTDGYFQKVASVMKLCIDGFAGAGTIEQGGYDYHDGTRATGEVRDLRAGIGIGMCLQYAANTGKPVMIYVFSDGSLASNGRIDDTTNGRGKCEWTGDNESTAASWAFVYNPGGRPALLGATPEEQAMHQQLGWMRSNGSVETSGTTPGANNVNLLVEMVILNYLALHGEQGNFQTLFPNNGLGPDLDRLTAFQPIV